MPNKNEEKPPLGGFLALVGAIVGVGVGNKVAGGTGAILGFFVGAYLGLVVEHIVFRLILVLLFILMLLARHAVFEGLRHSFSQAEYGPVVEVCAVERRSISDPVRLAAG